MTLRLSDCLSANHQGPGCAWRGAALLLLLILPLTCANAQPQLASDRAAQANQNSLPLALGEPIEKAIVRGETHAYALTLAAGQYLFVSADQRGIEVVVVLFGPDGKRLVTSDGANGSYGAKTVAWVTETTGVYRLDIRASEKPASAGRYEVKLIASRPATADDRALHEAAKLNDEAVSLFNQAKYADARCARC